MGFFVTFFYSWTAIKNQESVRKDEAQMNIYLKECQDVPLAAEEGVVEEVLEVSLQLSLHALLHGLQGSPREPAPCTQT